MAMRLEGAPVAFKINNDLERRIKILKDGGIVPCLSMINVGQKKDNAAYCKAAQKRCRALDIRCECEQFPEDASENDLVNRIEEINRNKDIHGILLFRPLPKAMQEEKVCDAILPEKDVDGVDQASMAGVYSGRELGFIPCTAEAVIRMLKYYRIELEGRTVTVIGRSPVIGRPVASLLIRENATVTVCHSHTKNLQELCLQSDIVIAAAGRAEFLKKEYFRPQQTVIDIGINYSEKKKKIVGDVDFTEVESLVKAITPVPAGVGSITTAILADHVVRAAEQLNRRSVC
jgi:methylenetetrahydrofolate dehydrogenase (NADP+)/methenyltetrahydrofolate cyclohydrolase